jgi:hypothetical protein
VLAELNLYKVYLWWQFLFFRMRMLVQYAGQGINIHNPFHGNSCNGSPDEE